MAAQTLAERQDAIDAENAAAENDRAIAARLRATIARSVSHNEIVHIEVDLDVDDLFAVLTMLNVHDTAVENDGSIDAWGTTDPDGDEWRIRVTLARRGI